jgi:hypothetical protein
VVERNALPSSRATGLLCCTALEPESGVADACHSASDIVARSAGTRATSGPARRPCTVTDTVQGCGWTFRREPSEGPSPSIPQRGEEWMDELHLSPISGFGGRKPPISLVSTGPESGTPSPNFHVAREKSKFSSALRAEMPLATLSARWCGWRRRTDGATASWQVGRAQILN